MIATPQNRTFTLADGREISIVFFHADRFGHVVRDHVLNDKEPWSRLLRLKVKRLENLRQQIDSGDVIKRDGAEEELYPECVQVFADGIGYSIEFPVYAEFVQERRRTTAALPYRTHGFYFVAEPGFLVVVRENVVRTARFEVGIKNGLPRVGLFREAWKYVKARITRTTEYLDFKEQTYVRHVSVHAMSAENWKVCPV